MSARPTLRTITSPLLTIALAILAGWLLGSVFPLPVRPLPRADQGIPVLTFPAVASVQYDVASSDGVTTTLTSRDAPSAHVPSAWLPDVTAGRVVMDTDIDIAPDHATVTATFSLPRQSP